MFIRIGFLICFISMCFGEVNIPSINDIMSVEDQRKTGVLGLKQRQKMELAKWLVDHGYYEAEKTNSSDDNLTLTMNDKKDLQLSDGSLWEVAPEDVAISSTWGSNAQVLLERTKNPLYPYNLLNLKTKEKVKVRVPYD